MPKTIIEKLQEDKRILDNCIKQLKGVANDNILSSMRKASEDIEYQIMRATAIISILKEAI